MCAPESHFVFAGAAGFGAALGCAGAPA